MRDELIDEGRVDDEGSRIRHSVLPNMCGRDRWFLAHAATGIMQGRERQEKRSCCSPFHPSTIVHQQNLPGRPPCPENCRGLPFKFVGQVDMFLWHAGQLLKITVDDQVDQGILMQDGLGNNGRITQKQAKEA